MNNVTASQTDGIDIDSTRNAYIAHNYISTGDDGIAFKSGMDFCGRKFNTPTTNATAEYNYFNFSGGIAIGSEMSGGISDIVAQHNIMRGDANRQPELWTWGPRVITLKGCRGRGGTIENVYIYNTTCIDCDQVIRVTFQNGQPFTNISATPFVKNVTLKKVQGTCETVGFFQSLPEAPIEMSVFDVVFDELYLEA